MIEGKTVTPDEMVAEKRPQKNRGRTLTPDKQHLNHLLVPEVSRVTCPLCSMGYADVMIYKNGDAFEANVDQPRRCNLCKRNFKLQWMVRLVGVPIPGEPGPIITPEG